MVHGEVEILSELEGDVVAIALVGTLPSKNIPPLPSRSSKRMKVQRVELYFEGESDRWTINGESDMRWVVERRLTASAHQSGSNSCSRILDFSDSIESMFSPFEKALLVGFSFASHIELRSRGRCTLRIPPFPVQGQSVVAFHFALHVAVELRYLRTAAG